MTQKHLSHIPETILEKKTRSSNVILLYVDALNWKELAFRRHEIMLQLTIFPLCVSTSRALDHQKGGIIGVVVAMQCDAIDSTILFGTAVENNGPNLCIRRYLFHMITLNRPTRP